MMAKKEEMRRKYSELRAVFDETEKVLPDQTRKIARLMATRAALDERPLTAIRKRYEGLMRQAEVIERGIRVPEPDEDRLMPSGQGDRRGAKHSPRNKGIRSRVGAAA
jgi:hypothetical protein